MAWRVSLPCEKQAEPDVDSVEEDETLPFMEDDITAAGTVKFEHWISMAVGWLALDVDNV